MAISDSFIELLDRIQPLETEVAAITQHIEQIKARLRATFDTSDFWLTGSFPRGTSIRGFSDADLFANFRKIAFSRAGNLISSNRVLLHIRQQLAARYPATPIRKDR